MNRVDWQRWAQSPAFEDAVSALLGTVHPTILRIDGSGGDGGRDCIFRTSDELKIYEMKSFTGRIDKKSPNRRRQVERSLKAASAHSPTSWHLVVPIDPSPGELDWFDGLRGSYPFPLEWLGKDWLDRQMAEHPDIVGYFFGDAHSEVTDLLKELGATDAAMETVVESFDRLDTVHKRLNQIDPHYAFEVIRGPLDASLAAYPGGVMYVEHRTIDPPSSHTLAVIPKYVTAPRDRPISIRTAVVFEDSPTDHAARDEFLASMRYGERVELKGEHLDAVEIDAPGGLSDVFTNPHSLTIEGINIVGPNGWPGSISVTDPSTGEHESLQLRFEKGTSGTDGIYITGEDITKLLAPSVRLSDVNNSTELNVQVRPFHGRYVHDVLPVARITAHIRPGAVIALMINGQSIQMTASSSTRQLIQPELVKLLEDIEYVGRVTGHTFIIPEQISPRDARNTAVCKRLLNGEQLGVSPSERQLVSPAGPDDIALAAAGGRVVQMMEVNPFSALILSETVEIPACKLVQTHVELVRPMAGDDATRLVARPTDDCKAYISLLTDDEIASLPDRSDGRA